MKLYDSIQGLYAITPQVNSQWTIQAVVECSEAVVAEGVRWLQCRQKDCPPEVLEALIVELASVCAPHRAGLILNDFDVAMVHLLRLEGVAGVHVGRHDMSIHEARRLVGAHQIVGASCYNQIDLAHKAVSGGASYVAFGAVFDSPTKPAAVKAPMDLFKHAHGLGVPVVGIGGIDESNLASLVSAGADAFAVITGLYGSQPDPGACAARARLLNEIIRSNIVGDKA